MRVYWRRCPLDSYFGIIDSYLSSSTLVKVTNLLKIDFLTEKLRNIKIGRLDTVRQGLNPS